jgi:hypothetical protein
MLQASNKRLSYLIRKNNGRYKLQEYKQFFKGFNLKKLEYIELEQSDLVLKEIEHFSSSYEVKSEVVDSLVDSSLLQDLLNLITYDDKCYIYNDDVSECGMFIASSRSVINNCLDIAFLTYNNTLFVVGHDFQFHLIIDYYDGEDRYDPNKFEIQKRTRK